MLDTTVDTNFTSRMGADLAATPKKPGDTVRAVPYTAGRRRVSSRMRAPGPRRSSMVSTPSRSVQPFELFLIKPSHYDDDGYVIQWVALVDPGEHAGDAVRPRARLRRAPVLGDDVEIRITVWDETNTRIRPDEIIAQIRAAGGRGLVGLVGVQTNQFPRAVDIARPLRAAGIPVVHRRLPRQRLPRDAAGHAARAARGDGPRHHALRRRSGGPPRRAAAAAYRGELKPLYNFMNDLPGLEGVPTPYLPVDVVRRTAGMRTSFDAGRGCPFLCSFCTIINVQGRKSRARNADDVERLVRANLAQGVHNFFITDDNLARNQNWEAIFDRLIHMREVEGLRIYDRRAGRHDGAQDPRLHREGGRAPASTACSSAWRTSTPESLKDAQKGQNQHHRVPRDAAGVAPRRRAHLRRLHPRLPGRHAGLDRARHRHHPARAADRPARVLHPHAAAGLRRPQEAASRGRARWSAT